MMKSGGWPRSTPAPASVRAVCARRSSRRLVKPGAASVEATRGWWRRPGGTRCAVAASSERKPQRQEVTSDHRAVERPVAAAVGDDETGRWMALHQALHVSAPQVHAASRLFVIGHFGDHVIGRGDQRLEFGGHLGIAAVAEANAVAL